MTRPTVQYRFNADWRSRSDMTGPAYTEWTTWGRYKTPERAEQALKALRACQAQYYEFRKEPK